MIDLALKTTRKVPVIRQVENAECGLICLAMIAAHWGFHANLSKLRATYGLSSRGLSIKSLLRIAHDMKFTPRAVKVPTHKVAALKLPCVLSMDHEHAVVLIKVSGNRFHINDPELGERILDEVELARHFSGIAIEVTPREDFIRGDERERKPWLSAVFQVPGFPSSASLALALAMVIQLCIIASPFMLQWSLDEVVGLNNAELLPRLAAVFIALAVFQALVTAVRAWVIAAMSSEIAFRWRSSAFTHLLSLPMKFFDTRFAGEIHNRFQSLSFLQRQFTTQFIEVFVDGVLVVVCAIALLFYSPLIAAISVAAVLSFALLRWAITGPLRRHTAEAIDQSTYQNILFYEAVRSIQTLKLYGQVAVRAAAWCARLSGELNAQTRIAILQLTQQSTGSLIGSLDRIAAICIGCLLVSRNELTAGGLFAILAFREQFSSKMFAMIERSVDFSLIGLHANRVGDILQAEPESENKDGYSVLPTETFSLQLERVSFSYAPMDPPVLRDLDIKVSQGETVAIVGPSGVGKTTVLKIMLGLFEPTGGQVIVNGRPLASINRTSYQSMIGTVMQDDTLLAGSIVDNVALFDERPDIELLKRCCDAAAIHETIQAMPMGYHSLVSEQGANLSGGQRQRLLLARALYRRPKLLLLDEATSHLDVDTERRVNEAISALGVTKVIVAHRPETIATADRQIRLQPASGGAFAQS